ncbi:reticulon-like protein B9 [Bidens hawaiensis]|uniref:reticulon-like protein B9 n=1 Tax=Bidens hawaiensis TaxID=980011 RepID=UPI0040499F9E
MSSKLFGRERPIHQVLGGGKVADVLLWRNKVLSGAHFLGVIVIWFLFEVAEYNLITIFCHLTITAMLVAYIWSNGARAFNWSPPNIPVIQLEEAMLYNELCEKLNIFLSILINIASGSNIIHFCLTIFAMKLLAMVGNCVSTSNLLFIGSVCMGTLPCLYEKNEAQVDSLVDMMNQEVLGIYEMLKKNVISKIPKRPLKSD